MWSRVLVLISRTWCFQNLLRSQDEHPFLRCLDLQGADVLGQMQSDFPISRHLRDCQDCINQKACLWMKNQTRNKPTKKCSLSPSWLCSANLRENKFHKNSQLIFNYAICFVHSIASSSRIDSSQKRGGDVGDVQQSDCIVYSSRAFMFVDRYSATCFDTRREALF